MPVVWIPSLLRGMTGGQDKLTIPGRTIREVLDELDRRFPGTKARLCEGDELRPGVAVAINAQLARRGLREVINDASEVHFVHAASGG